MPKQPKSTAASGAVGGNIGGVAGGAGGPRSTGAVVPVLADQGRGRSSSVLLVAIPRVRSGEYATSDDRDRGDGGVESTVRGGTATPSDWLRGGGDGGSTREVMVGARECPERSGLRELERGFWGGIKRCAIVTCWCPVPSLTMVLVHGE